MTKDQKIAKLGKVILRASVTEATVSGVQSHYYMDFLVWLLNCWGIVPLTDMLSMDNTDMIAEVDTPENRHELQGSRRYARLV